MSDRSEKEMLDFWEEAWESYRRYQYASLDSEDHKKFKAIRRLIEKGPEVDEKKLFRIYNACWERDTSMSFGVFLKSLELLGVLVKEEKP
jgi:hypothetical protein